MRNKTFNMGSIIENTIKKYKVTGIGNEATGVKSPKKSTGLIYHKYFEKDLPRISEQELKILFYIELIRKGIAFSVETPTIMEYSFQEKKYKKDKKYISGRVDVCIYDFTNGEHRRKNNIEFKAHNSEKELFRDFAKLISEKGDNYFIHVLPTADKGDTIKSAIENYLKNIEKTYKDINKYVKKKNGIKDINNNKKVKNLTFYICVIEYPNYLKPSFLLKNTINCKDNIANIKEKLKLDRTIEELEKARFGKIIGGWKKIKI